MTKPYRTVIDDRSSTQDLTTIDSVKLDLGLDPLDTSKDTWILAQIRQTSNAIASYCNRTFGEETISNYFNVDWGYRGSLQLSRFPATEIISVTECNTLLTPDKYEIDEESGLLWAIGAGNSSYSYFLHHGRWLGGTVHVQFKAGYQLLSTLPYDLERAANMMVKSSYYAKSRDPMVRSESIPGVMTYDYGSGASTINLFVNSELSRLLEPYKVPAYG